MTQDERPAAPERQNIRPAPEPPGWVHKIGELNHFPYADPDAAAEVGVFAFQDADGHRLLGGRRLTPYLTIKDGQLWWKRSGP